MNSLLAHPNFRDGFVEALDHVETPGVVIDRQRLERNIARMAGLAGDRATLRPHAKTHKSLALAHLQIDAGASGITVAKPSEAEVFLEGGVSSVTIAYPLVVPSKIERIARVATERGADLRLLADSRIGIEAIAAAARIVDRTFPVYLKIDVGLHRCGVTPESAAALELARQLSDTRRITFAGILSHAGHAYRVSDAKAVRAIADAERRAMTTLAERLRADGIAVPEVSVGCTPTVALNAGLDGITELRPGNYVFMDRIQVGLGAATLPQVALWVASTVVSVNDRYAIVDAGSKILSSDRGPHGSQSIDGYGLAWRIADVEARAMVVSSLSEEHGIIDHNGHPPRIGERLILLPNHACPVVNLAPALSVVGDEGTVVPWRVDARAAVA